MGLVLVLRLVGHKSAGVVVVGQDDSLAGDVETDTKLAARLRSEASRSESLNLAGELHSWGLWSSPHITIGASVSPAREAVFVTIGVEGIGVRRPTRRAWDVSDELGVLLAVVYWSHSGGMER